MAHQTRFKNGLAFGPKNNFAVRTDNLFAENDTTPDVSNGCLFYSNNTTATVITDFDLRTPSKGGSQSGDFEGKVITVVTLDTGTTIASNSRILLSGSDNLQGANNTISLIYHNSAWLELHRSANVTNFLSLTSSDLGATGIFDARNKKVIVTQATAGSATVLRRATNGEQGQSLTIYNGGSATTIVVNSAAADTFVGSSSANALSTLVMSQSSAIQFIRIGNKWIENRPLVTGSVSWIL